MKIVHVSRQYHPGLGGLESFTRNLCREQVRAGHQVRMVTLDRIFDGDGSVLPASEMIDGVEVIRVPFRGGRRYPLAPAVVRHLGDCDLVHVHAVDFFVDYLSIARLLHRKPLVLSTHGGFFHTDFARRLKDYYFNTISRQSLSRFDAVIACSDSDYDSFARICRSKLTLVDNGVDIEKFAGLADPSGASRTIIYFGRIAPNKQIDLLVRWFGALHRLDPSWSLIVAGKPMGVTMDDLRAAAAESGVTDAVEFHESPSDDGLRTLIGRSSIFASASAYEGFGISLIEGASAGLYPGVSDIPAHRKNIGALGVGSLIDFADPHSAARLLQDYRAARAQGAMAKAAEPLRAYSWPQVADRISAIYEDVLGRTTRFIGPVKVAVLSEQEALAQVDRLVREQQGKVIAFCNAHMTNLARRNDALRAALDDALILNDGVGVDIASRWRYGAAFPENLNGTDFIPQLLDKSRGELRLFLLGAAPGVADRAGRILEQRYPHVRVVGTQHGFFDAQEETALSDRIRASGANLVIAAMGNPRQEIWAARWAESLQRPILCAGAFLDFTAGQVQRAPAWLRQMRLEWTYRLLQEPSRLADRYLKGNISFLAHAWKDARRGYQGGSLPPPAPQPAVTRGVDAA